ncbi:MAG: NAD-binding protein [Gammaproteobacteria bacterium]|nr:NAD-binding protein [Gammaproteobacteria bacterium]
MHNIIYLLLRRMRAPLIVIILAYAISILGLVLIPGMDDQGNPWQMSFFHAFYFVSFMGSTIGFGEIPYPFTDPQRIWTTVAMYMTVIAWLFTIGSLLSLIQDQAFRRVVAYTSFSRAVRRIREPFYLVCGLGGAGQLVIRELAEHGIRSVVIDKDETRIHALQLEELPTHVPGLNADVTDSNALMTAGLNKQHCAGVIVLTGDDQVNLTVAITSKLLAPELSVICRAQSHDAQANIASFGTEIIINPFDIFAERLAMMFRSPSMYLVYEWMTSLHETPLTEFAAPPRGTWILCGYGRFGKALQKSLSFKGIQTTIIEADVEGTNAPESVIEGRGTEAITLYEAGIEQAVGLIAGTDDDANNLSIIMTGLHINKDLFTVARQNRSNNDAIFAAADTDMTMHSGRLVGKQVVDIVTMPLLRDFLHMAILQNDDWANVLVSRIVGILTDRPPESWELTISTIQSQAVTQLLKKDVTVTVKDLLMDPRDISTPLPCVPLYIKHQNNQELLLPADETPLQIGDQLLICGHPSAETHMRWTARNSHALKHICTGFDRPSGSLWRWLSTRRSDRTSR